MICSHRSLIIPALAILFFSAFSDLSAGIVFSGRSQSLIYNKENLLAASDTSGENNYRYYQYLRLNLSRKGENNTLSFHTYLRVTDDLNVDYAGDPGWRLYNGYLKWQTGSGSLSVGRQWLNLGPGSLTLDGFQGSIGLSSRNRLTGYLGMESPFTRYFNLNGWDKARSGGLYFSSQASDQLKLGVGWYQKNRDGEVAFRELGFDTKTELPHDFQITGRLDLNLLTDRVQRGVVRCRYLEHKRWQFLGEYKHYEPRLFYQSYFSRFEPKANDQVRGGVVYSLFGKTTLSTSYSAVFFDDERSGYLSLGVNCEYGSVTYYRGDGFGGDENGVAVSANWPFWKKFELFADLDYSRYRFYEEEDLDYLFSSIFGINWRPRADINTGLEFQDLNNQVFSKDFRVMFKFSYNYNRVF